MRYRVLVIAETTEYPAELPIPSKDFVEIYHSKSMQDALFHLSTFSYHLVVISHMTDVVRICKVIETVKGTKSMPIIVLCDDNPEERAICIEYGADLALGLSTAESEIRLYAFALIKRYLKQQGEKATGHETIQEGLLRINYHSRKVYWDDKEIKLSDREFQFLFLLAATPGRVYTFGQIYQIVWGDEVHGDINNILNCTLHRIRKKMKAVDPATGELIRNYRNTGYYLEIEK